MKKLVRLAIISALVAFFMLPLGVGAQIKKEHRAVWVSAYVSDWPANPITPSTAENHKFICRNMLDSLQVNNFTTVYYHVRTLCDAMYDSKYEPWSHTVSPVRGEAPAFDPLKYILEEGHKRGIEVYAWMNPYRYRNLDATWKECENDYINTHPEWLLSNATQMVLNPAIPEVEQRIVDVTKDIITKYDVDGVVFDDYFYPAGGMKSEYANADATWYNAYATAGGKLSLADWRRENVNRMVRKVNAAIKETKPWVRFGISPAGVAGTASTSASKYGVMPSPGGDWQYDQIYSDPLAWMSEGTIDFISPQVYWPIDGTNDFDALAKWWSYIAKKFNRHFYVSQSIPEKAVNIPLFDEYTQEINLTRNYSEDASPGTVYFRWKTLRYGAKTVDRKVVRLLNYLKRNSFTSKSLTPAVTWSAVAGPGVPSNIAYADGVLTWSGVENMRYVVYAIPENMEETSFTKEAEYIVRVSYETSFEMPKDKKEGHKYAVAYLDRYGNEYSAVFAGAEVKDAPKSTPTFPVNDASVSDLFTFMWNGDAHQYIIEVADDVAMTNVLYRVETDAKMLSSVNMQSFKPGKYYWRVVSRKVNCRDSYSDIQGVNITPVAIVSPVADDTNVSITPTIAINGAVGATYLIEFAEDNAMENVVFSEKVTSTEYTVPQFSLSGGTKYYVRVKVMNGDNFRYTNIVNFTTLDVVPSTPRISATDGAILYSNSRVYITPEVGILRTRLEISATDAFPPRSSYIASLENFVFESKEMSAVKLSGNELKDGSTYYIRARFEYSLSSSSSNFYTDYTSPVTFVYNSGVGVEGVDIDKNAYITGETLIIPNANGDESICVYSTSGALVDKYLGGKLQSGYNEINLSSIPCGVFIIKVIAGKTENVIKYIK